EMTSDRNTTVVRTWVAVDVMAPVLTRILHQTLAGGSRVRHVYFAQFVARASSIEPRPGPDVREARWFESLPPDLAFRDDYVADFTRFVRPATFSRIPRLEGAGPWVRGGRSQA